MTDFSKMTVQSIIALEGRTSREQDKRKTLLASPEKLTSYAKEREISTSKMKSLISDNYKNNADILKSVRAYMKTSDFKEKQKKQTKAKRTIKFRSGGGGSSDSVRTIFEGPSLIKMDKLDNLEK